MARHFEWDAPAKLFFWPAPEGGEEDAVYPTLTDALRAAGEGDLACAWIVAQNGDILTPRMIEVLRDQPAPSDRRRRLNPMSLLGWARAA